MTTSNQLAIFNTILKTVLSILKIRKKKNPKILINKIDDPINNVFNFAQKYDFYFKNLIVPFLFFLSLSKVLSHKDIEKEKQLLKVQPGDKSNQEMCT